MSAEDSVSPAPESRPALRIVKGDPTPVEIAALVTVVSTIGAPTTPPKRPTPTWSAHQRKVRSTLPRGRGGWHSSRIPH